MRRGLITLGALLLVFQPIVGLALGFIPFDPRITRSFYVLNLGLITDLFMLAGVSLLVVGLLRRRS